MTVAPARDHADRGRVYSRAASEIDEKDDRELQSLGRMDRHQVNCVKRLDNGRRDVA